MTDAEVKALWEEQTKINAEFNAEWKEHLSDGHYGMGIGNEKVAKYLNREFKLLKLLIPDFEYQQIKLKFGKARIYLSSETAEFELMNKIANLLETRVDEILAE